MSADTTPEDTTARLAQIRDRAQRLAVVPLETSASNYIMRDMIDSIGDVRWLLERAETAERELAEVRERIGEAIAAAPEPEAPDNYAVPAWYDGYERAVEDAARIARERKAADDA